jgi:hypothetical protein
MRRIRYHLLTATAVLLSLLWGAGGQARAETLFLQPYDFTSNAGISQVFGDVPAFSTKLFDDFLVTGNGWNITGVTIVGKETGNPALNQAISLSFTRVPEYFPPAGSPPIITGGQEVQQTVGNIVFSNLVFSGLNVQLPPGQWWVSAWVTRPLDPGGQWYWYRTTLGNQNQDDLEHWFQNPGDGFMLGSEPQEGHVLFGDVRDLSFEIDGTVTIPEPSTLRLLVVGALTLLLIAGRRALPLSPLARLR